MSPPFAQPDSQRRRLRVRAVTEKAAGTTSASSVMILTEQFARLPLPKVERPGGRCPGAPRKVVGNRYRALPRWHRSRKTEDR